MDTSSTLRFPHCGTCRCDPDHSGTGNARLAESAGTLRSDIDADIAHLEDLLARLKERRNRCALISRLPAEVLLNIFEYLPLGRMRERGWFRFSLVCRQWRSLAFGWAALWTDLDISGSSSFVEEMLDRSRSLPLTAYNREDSHLDDSALDRVWQELPRITAVSVSLPPAQFRVLLKTLSVPSSTRTLEKLQIQVVANNRFHHVFTLFQAPPVVSIPQLKVIDLEQCFINLDPGTLDGLESLILTEVPRHMRFTVSRVLDYLSHIPKVKTLRLQQIFVEDPSPAQLAVGSHRVVPLINLRHVELVASASIWLALIPRLSLSPYAHMHFDSADNAAESLIPLRGVLLEMVSRYMVYPADYEIVLDFTSHRRSKFSLHISGHTSTGGIEYQHHFSFKIEELNNNPEHNVLAIFGHPLSLIRAKRLRMVIDSWKSTETWQTFFSHLPTVETFDIRGHLSAHTFLAALGIPVTSAKGGLSFPFPNLRTLALEKLYVPEFIEELQTWLLARSAAGTTSGIRKLVFVDCVGRNEIDTFALREAVPEVEWGTRQGRTSNNVYGAV